MNIREVPKLDINDGRLTFDGHDLTGIAEKYGSPIYVCSETRIIENINEVTSAFRKYHPDTSVHYASKAETTLATLQVIQKAGCDLEVNSGGELYIGLKAGFKGSQIVFNGVAKSVAEIEMAITNDIKSINVDSEYELNRIIETAKRLDKCASVIIRIVPDVASGVANGIQTGTHECKFGTMMDDVQEMIELCLRESRYVHLKGFHLHVGTQTYNLRSFVDSFNIMLDFCTTMKDRTGYMPEILDIGGGLPIPYFIDVSASQYIPHNLYEMLRGNLSTSEIAEAVAGTLHDHRGGFGRCELVIEPGRKIVGDAFVMVSRVENYKYRRLTDETWAMLDAGLNVMSEVKNYHWYFPMVCANKITEPHTKSVKFGGPLCESGDVWMDYENHSELPDYRLMPESLEPGDYIAMLETGAYGTSMMNRYNGRPMTGVVMIREDGSELVTRPPENYESLIRDEISLN